MLYLRPFGMVSLLVALACCGGEPALGHGDSGGASSSSGTGGSDPSTGDGDWAQICDGSDALRLAMVLGGGGQVMNEIERDIGFKYLYVLGTCEYYALPLRDGLRWLDARTGVMDGDTEEALSRAIDYGGLGEIAGSWTSGGVLDGSTLTVSDGTRVVSCYGGCDLGPPAAQALWGQMDWIDTLWEQGEPLLGPLRLSVVRYPRESDSLQSEPWPLSVDPGSIAVDAGASWEQPTVRIDDGDDLAILHELRRQYRENDLPAGTPNTLNQHGHLIFHDASGEDLFFLWMRDALPLEDENGRIALTAPP